LAGKAGIDLAGGHHPGERLAFRHMLDVWRQFQRLYMFFVVHHPGYLRRVEPVLLVIDAARPHAGRDGIGAYADALAFEILGMADIRFRTDQHAAMVEGTEDEDRQRDERCPERARDEIGRRRQLADVEFETAHHAPEGGDLRHDVDELRFNPGNGRTPALDGFRMRIIANGYGKRNFL
jgi:hypothetical protein